MVASKNPLFRLYHIRDEINAILGAMSNVDRPAFIEDYVLRRAAERALLIISETAKSLPTEPRLAYPQIDWAGVVGLGNILRHEYQSVDADTLFEIVVHKLPERSPVIDRMILDQGG